MIERTTNICFYDQKQNEETSFRKYLNFNKKKKHKRNSSFNIFYKYSKDFSCSPDNNLYLLHFKTGYSGRLPIHFM